MSRHMSEGTVCIYLKLLQPASTLKGIEKQSKINEFQKRGNMSGPLPFNGLMTWLVEPGHLVFSLSFK